MVRLIGTVAVLLSLCSFADARHFSRKTSDDLPNLNGAPGDSVIIQGHTTAGDGGGQLLVYSTNGETVNDGFVFDAPGGGNERWVAADQSIADPVKFGATSIANPTVTKAAFDAAILTGKPVVNRDPTRVFTVNAGIVNGHAHPMEIAGTIVSTDTTLPVVTIGQTAENPESGVEAFCTNKVYRLSVARSAYTSTATADGVRVINCNDGEFHISAANCESGLHVLGSNTFAPTDGYGSCSRNKFFLGNINNCYTGVHLEASGVDGYCNENTFYGGEIDTSDNIATATHLKGFRCTFSGGNNIHYLDGNRVYGTSIELHNSNASATYAIFGDFTDDNGATNASLCALENMFLDIRCETTDVLVGGRGFQRCTFRTNFLLAFDNIVDGYAEDSTTPNVANELKILAENKFDLRHNPNEWTKLFDLTPAHCVNTASGVSAPPHGTLMAALENSNEVGGSMARAITSNVLELNTSTSPRWYAFFLDLSGNLGAVYPGSDGIVNGGPDELNLANGDEVNRVIQVIPTLAENGGRIFARCYNASFGLEEGPEDCSLYEFITGVEGYFASAPLVPQSTRPFVHPIAFGPSVRYVVLGIGQHGGGGTDDLHLRRLDVLVRRDSGIRLIQDEATILQINPTPTTQQYFFDGIPRSNVIPNDTTVPHGTLVRNTSTGLRSLANPLFWQYDKATTTWVPIGSSNTTVTATSGTTVSVANAAHVHLDYVGGATITDFTNGVNDQVIIVTATNANPVLDNGATIKLEGAADLTFGASGGSVMLKRRAGVWEQIGDSIAY